jgi:hypothetical protein
MASEDPDTVAIEDVPQPDDPVIRSCGYIVRIGMKLHTLKE